jgi:hypothetical protein
MVKDFLISTSYRPVLGPNQSAIKWVKGAFSPRINRPGCENNHSPIRLHGVVFS